MEPAQTPASLIVGPLPCVKCLYDLAGLQDDQRCPECGTPIRLSIEAAAPDSPINRALFCRGIGFAASAMIGGPSVLVACVVIALMVLTAYATAAEHTVRTIIATIVLLPTAIFPWISARGWAMVARARLHPRGRTSALLGHSAMAFAVLQPLMIAAAFAGSRTTVLSTLNKTLGLITWAVLVAALLVWILRTILGFRITIASLRFAQLRWLSAIGVWLSLLLAISSICFIAALARAYLGSAPGPIEAMGYLGASGMIGIVIGLFGGGAWLLFAQSRLHRHWAFADAQKLG